MMKKPLIILVALLTLGFLNVCNAQKKIKAEDAGKYIGKKVRVIGTVTQITKTDKTIYLNIDGKFPDNTFTAVIFAKNKDLFKDLDSYEGKKVMMTGTIKEYKDKPEMILETAKQIKLK